MDEPGRTVKTNSENVIKRKAFGEVGQTKRRVKKPLKTGQSTWKPSLNYQVDPDPSGEVIHIVEVIDDSYMMPENSAVKLDSLQRDLSSFMQRQDGATVEISKILKNQESYLNDHGRAIRIMLQKVAHYDRAIPHLERKTTLIDRRVDIVEKKLEELLKAHGNVSNQGGKPTRRMVKCKFCGKQMLKTSLVCHVRRQTCPVLKSGAEVAETEVKQASGNSRSKLIP